jgi:hypothetical protein
VESTCAARGCNEPVHITKLMCPDHWDMVPRAIQEEVNRTYRVRRSRGGGFFAPHATAMAKAIKAVPKVEAA